MKWTNLALALVLSMGLSSQSFGFELLDSMLGGGHGGYQSSCCQPEPTCCEPAPACCEPAPKHCEPAPARCDAAPACCDQGPSCCDSPCGSRCGNNQNLIDMLFGPGCKPAAKVCCDKAPVSDCCDQGSACCDQGPTCCGQKKSCCGGGLGLLDGLFSCNKKRTCGPSIKLGGDCCKKSCCKKPRKSACGCGGRQGYQSYGAPVESGPAPGQPAPSVEEDGPPAPPMVDPSAVVPAQRRVVQASINVLR